MDFQLPNKYRFLKVLGEGVYGKVLECEDVDSMQTVAIKIPMHYQIETEVSMLKMLMDHNFDQHCIVKFLDSFKTPSGEAMVFEALDISLYDYICKVHPPPMQLDIIRTVVQQVATALDALKSIGVTHTDLKLDNIMLVDHLRQPLRLKLIDFGLAKRTSKMKRGCNFQPFEHRAPEVILGQCLSEAIDIWSLGSIMFNMLTGELLYETCNNYESMWAIVQLFGQPADHLLDNGKKTKQYFYRTHTRSWKLKTPLEYHGQTPEKKYTDLINRLDDLKRIRLEQLNKAEAVERDQCIELMKAMLKLDPKERLTPSEVLKHPFITQNSDSNNASGCATQKPFDSSNSQDSSTAVTDASTADIQPDHCRSVHANKPSRVEALQPATADKTLVLKAKERAVRFQSRVEVIPRDTTFQRSRDSTARDEIITKKRKKRRRRRRKKKMTKSHASRFWCWMKKIFSGLTCNN